MVNGRLPGPKFGGTLKSGIRRGKHKSLHRNQGASYSTVIAASGYPIDAHLGAQRCDFAHGNAVFFALKRLNAGLVQ